LPPRRSPCRDRIPDPWSVTSDCAASDEEFAKVSVDPEAGTIVWPNGADLSPSMLYSGVASGLPAS